MSRVSSHDLEDHPIGQIIHEGTIRECEVMVSLIGHLTSDITGGPDQEILFQDGYWTQLRDLI
jgi:hypothetical protein